METAAAIIIALVIFWLCCDEKKRRTSIKEWDKSGYACGPTCHNYDINCEDCLNKFHENKDNSLANNQ